MTEGVENHSIRLLQEMRTEMRELRGNMNEMRTDITQRLDGNTVLLNLIAGVTHDHEQRLSALEGTTQS